MNVVGPKDKPELSGVYTLTKSQSSLPDPNCADGCIYTMGNDEFCFKDVPIAESAKVTCDGQTNPLQPSVTTKAPGSPPAGATPPPGAGTPPPPAATTPPPGATTPPAGAGTPPPPGATTPPAGAGTTLGLASQAADANNRKKKTEKDLAEASAFSTELTAVEAKIAALKTQNGRREKRQEATVAPITTCQSFLDAINAINTAVGADAATANIAKALTFAKAITAVDPGQITCSQALITNINTAN